MSAVPHTVAAMHHHPWRAFRELTDWTLRWAQLPDGVWGQTCWVTKTVTLTTGMNQAERRCTIAHETQHVLRGPVPAAFEVREEVAVDRNVARLLLPDIHAIGEALAWAPRIEEAAEELWVDGIILETRLRTLHPSERAYLRRRLEYQSG